MTPSLVASATVQLPASPGWAFSTFFIGESDDAHQHEFDDCAEKSG
jgi:hypothetical protein